LYSGVRLWWSNLDAMWGCKVIDAGRQIITRSPEWANVHNTVWPFASFRRCDWIVDSFLGAQVFPSESSPLKKEQCLNLGDAYHQAARILVSSVTSTPSLNLVPSMTFGNWLQPFRRSHFFAAAWMRLNCSGSGVRMIFSCLIELLSWLNNSCKYQIYMCCSALSWNRSRYENKPEQIKLAVWYEIPIHFNTAQSYQ